MRGRKHQTVLVLATAVLWWAGAASGQGMAEATALAEQQYERVCTVPTPDIAATCAMMRMTMDRMKAESSVSVREKSRVGGVIAPNIPAPQQPRHTPGTPRPTPRPVPPAAEESRPWWAAGRDPSTADRVSEAMGRQPAKPGPARQVFRGPLPNGYGNAAQRAYWSQNCENQTVEQGSVQQSNCNFLLDRTGAREMQTRQRPDGSYFNEPPKDAPGFTKWRSAEAQPHGAAAGNPLNRATGRPCISQIGSEWRRRTSVGSNANEAFHIARFQNSCAGTAVVEADRGNGHTSSGGIRGSGTIELTCANVGVASCSAGHLGWRVRSYTE